MNINENPDNDSLPPALLPPEIIRDFILKDLSIDDLQNCAKVSKVWQKWASEIVAEKVKRISDIIPSKTFQEMKSITKISAAGEFVQEEGQGGIDLSGRPDVSIEEAAILNTFERTFVPPNLGVGYEEGDECSNGIPECWIRSYAKVRGCGCNDETEEIKCLISELRFFPKYSLIVVPARRKLAFFHEEDPINSLTDDDEGDKYLTPYIIDPKEFFTSPDAHSCISIYGERFVTQETTRWFILCHVTSVDHHKRIIEIQRLRRIFLPFWSTSLLLYQEKVYILYTTGQLGVWIENPDAITILNTGSLRLHPESVLFRMNNLIMIKFSTNSNSDFWLPPIWIMLDGDMDETILGVVEMPKFLVRQVLPRHDLSNTSINRIDIWNNALILHVTFSSQHNRPGSTSQMESMIFTFRMKRDPELNDFTCKSDFGKLDLFHSVPDETISYISVTGTTTSPFHVLKKNMASNKVGMIVEYRSIDPDAVSLQNISIRCNEEVGISTSGTSDDPRIIQPSSLPDHQLPSTSKNFK